MAVSAFSKVGDIDDDDEEEQRLEISQKAMAQYAAAQRAYENKISSEEVLRLFEEAEGTMRPLLCNGLGSLEAKELETVLKGRLHQAVTLAQLGQGDRWPRIKALAEDVLQFDFNNAHARWLRGLALQHFAKPLEAEQECRRAVECARMQGKDAEANSWEAEVLSTFASDPSLTTPAAPAAQAAPPEPETKETKSAMTKGFLNRSAKKTREPEPAEAPVPAAATVTEAKLKEAELRSQLAALQAQLTALEADRGREAMEVAMALQEIKELPEELSSSLSSGASALEAVQEKLLTGRTWAEKEQQRYVEVSTEVLTLQQMTQRESKEQEETAEKQCTELRTLSSRLQDQLKQLRQLDLKAGQADDEDVARLAHHVEAFQRLPWRPKLAAMLEDGALLWLLAFIVLLGMLFTLSLIVELWFSSKCRLTCEIAGP